MVIIVPMAAYGIGRTNNKWTNGIYVYFLVGMMIPFQVYMIPLFKELKMMGLFGTLAGPIVIYISGSVGFGVLLTLAPSGRFRFKDASFEDAVKQIAYWEDQIVQHPDTFARVRVGADLVLAHGKAAPW